LAHIPAFDKGLSEMFLPILLITICVTDLQDDRQADMAFGRSQVAQVICDRPDMGPIIQSNADLSKTLAILFAGPRSELRVYWDCREPVSGRPAEHHMLWNNYPAMVRVSSNIETGVDKCAALVFELSNMPVDREWKLLFMSLPEKRKSRKDFATDCVEAEYLASKRTQTYFQLHPIADETDEANPYYQSLMALSGDFDDYLNYLHGLDKDSYNPLEYFGSMYDRVIPTLPNGELEKNNVGSH
jgi:hypothetical protein